MIGWRLQAVPVSYTHLIVEDLKVAADKLKGVTQPTIYRVNELATRILLSRVYLYMGEWQLALDECQKALALEGVELMDLKSFPGREGERYVLDLSLIHIYRSNFVSKFYRRKTFRGGEMFVGRMETGERM